MIQSIVRALSSQHLLNVWEAGASQRPLDRALTCLAAVTDRTRDELASLSIGRRDALLLEARQLTFGRWMDSFVRCPECDAELEFRLDTDVLRAESDLSDPVLEGACQHAGYRVCFRLPSSRDIANAATSTPEERRSTLLADCIVAATKNGAQVANDRLPSEVQAVVEESMAKLDPLAEIVATLDCSECGHRWPTFIDITTFLWREIQTAARRVLREVHLLARVYGWSEAEILSMSAARRRAYLEMAYS